MADYLYRVVSEHDDGEIVTTVSFANRDYAEKLWHRKGRMPHVKRVWIERQPIGDWEVCSSEVGNALAGALRKSTKTTFGSKLSR